MVHVLYSTVTLKFKPTVEESTRHTILPVLRDCNVFVYVMRLRRPLFLPDRYYFSYECRAQGV